MKRLRLFATAVGLSSLLIAGSATPAFAATPDGASQDQGQVVLMVHVNGKKVPFGPDYPVQALHLNDTPQPKPGGVSTNLINFSQYYGCYTLNHADDIFATFYTPSVMNSQPGRKINLRCGTDKSYGYRHIASEHQSQWETVFNAAKAKGWNNTAQGLNSWDDLMATSSDDAIAYPNFTGGNVVNQTTCSVVNMDFYKVGGGLIYTFNVRVGYSNTNDRLITSFPQGSKTTC